MSEQLGLPLTDGGVPRGVLAGWRLMPFRDRRRCVACGEVVETAGRRRSSQRCLPCYARLPASRR